MNYIQSARAALDEMLARDKHALVCGQLVRWGTAGLTEGLYEKYPEQVITYPVSESLMNASAMGLALAGSRVVMIHERMDFVTVGMDALVNHIPIWQRKCGVALPLTIIGIVGKGHGQGAQHSKNFAHWFRDMEGWFTVEPQSASEVLGDMRVAVGMARPCFVALHREFFKHEGTFSLPQKQRIIGLCGASPSDEQAFYGE
jgi:pyruvate/2-oxoglutarate/acetoin dehydrogenase E1 component